MIFVAFFSFLLSALTPEQEAQAVAIGSELRCPVCQGMPIAESPATMAQDMMAVVREKVAQGQSQEQIFQFFTERYGTWVLLKPPYQGASAWLWWFTPIIFIALMIWGVLRLQRSIQR